MGCYIILVGYSEEGTGRGRSLPGPILAVPNVTAHPSKASVPITVCLYNDALLCGFTVAIKALKIRAKSKRSGVTFGHHVGIVSGDDSALS